MYKIIASLLFLHKKCTLSGIGTLSMVSHSAVTDFLSTRIQAPNDKIEFIPNSNEINLLPELTIISNFIKNKLEKDGSVLLEGIGTFTKFSNGKLDFYPITIDPVFIPDIKVEKAVIKEPVQEIFKEDKQTTDIEIDEYFNTNETTFERWKISAIVLLSISLLLIIIYISQRGFNLFGNIGSY
jgi:hypothetical protein